MSDAAEGELPGKVPQLADLLNWRTAPISNWTITTQIAMATEWGETLQGMKLHGAYGTRDIMIISQNDSLQGPDIQPRGSLELTDSDRNQLQRLGIPINNWQDDASIMAARCALDKEYTLLPMERNMSGETLTKAYVLSKIEEHMKTTMKAGCKYTENTNHHCMVIVVFYVSGYLFQQLLLNQLLYDVL